MSAKIYNFPTPEQQLEVVDVVSERPRLLNAAVNHVLQVQNKERTNASVMPLYNYGERLAPDTDPAQAVPAEGNAQIYSLDDYRSQANSVAQPSAESFANMKKELGETA